MRKNNKITYTLFVFLIWKQKKHIFALETHSNTLNDMKNTKRTIIEGNFMYIILAICILGLSNRTIAFDFSATCPTGQMLYYNIIDQDNHFVALTYPGEDSISPYYPFEMPTGNIVLPTSVLHDGINYSVTEIGDYALATCFGLTGELIIPSTITRIGVGCFLGCEGFTGALVIPESVTIIDDEAFMSCSGFNGDLTIGNNVVSIGNLAFAWCGFTGTLTIGESVSQFGANPFLWCTNISRIDYNAKNNTSINSNQLPFNNMGTFDCINLGVNVEHLCDGHITTFSGCVCDTFNFNAKNLQFNSSYQCPIKCQISVLNICDSVTTIPQYLFYRVEANEINIGNSVITIEDNAFAYSDITSVTFGNSLQSIGFGSFESCSFLEGVVFPESLQEIQTGAFRYSGVTYAIFPSSLTKLGNYAFSASALQTLSLPNSLDSIHDNTFNHCQDLHEIINFPTDIRYIGDYAFRDCENLSEIPLFPNTLNHIGEEAFYGCYAAKGVLYIPESLIEIPESAFRYCSELEGIIVNPNNPNYDSRFDCNALVLTETNRIILGCINSTIPNSITTIGQLSFYSIEGLSQIIIGNTVETIESDAFTGCANLSTVICLCDTPPTFIGAPFWYIGPNPQLIVSCGNKDAYMSSNWSSPSGFGDNIIEDCDEYAIIPDNTSTGGEIIVYDNTAQMGDIVTITVIPDPSMQLLSIIAYNSEDSTQTIPIYPSSLKNPLYYSLTMPPFPVTIIAVFTDYDVLVETTPIKATIFPNPTNSFITVKAENIKHIHISNMLGQCVYECKVKGDSFEYNISRHKIGTYIISIDTGNGIITKRVVVRK